MDEKTTNASDDSQRRARIELPPGAEEIVTRIVAEELLRKEVEQIGDLKIGKCRQQEEQQQQRQQQQHILRCFHANVRSLLRLAPSICLFDDLEVGGLVASDPLSTVRGYSLLAIICGTIKILPAPLDLIQRIWHANPAATWSLSTAPGKSQPSSNPVLPLHLASQCPQHSSLGVISFLVEKHPQALQTTDGKGKLPLHLACSSSRVSLDVINVMVHAYPLALSKIDKLGLCPLDCALRKGAPASVLERLAFYHGIEQGNELLTQRDRGGQTRLHHICKSKHGPFESIEFLVQRVPSCIHVIDNGQKTPLQYAALSHSVRVLKLLLSCSNDDGGEGDPPLLDPSGYNLLHYAVLTNTVEVVEFLVSEFPHMVMEATNDLDERLPLHMLIAGRHAFSFADSKLSFCKILVQSNPSSLLVRDGMGKTSLEIAELVQDSTLISYLEGEIQRLFSSSQT